MAEKVCGDLVESQFKQFGPEDAGQKVGWSTAIPNPDGESFYMVGAYATVGESGGSVSIMEDKSNSERLHLVTGMSRACAYAILVIPDEDTRLRNSDLVLFDRDSAKMLVGHSLMHGERNIDDDTVVWAKGDEEITTAIQMNLEQYDGLDQYPRVYLTINGSVSHGTAIPGFPSFVPTIVKEQIYDPALSPIAAGEKERFTEYADILAGQAQVDAKVLEHAQDYQLRSKEFVASREQARFAFLRIAELRNSMIAPAVAYTPEGYRRTWPYMDASEADRQIAYGRELHQLEIGNFAAVTHELENEIKELEKRQEFARRGAQAMFALTVDSRQ